MTPAKPAKGRKTAAKPKKAPAKKAPTAAQHLARLRRSAVLVSVHGPFGSRVMIDLPTDAVMAIFPSIPAPSGVTDGVERDLEGIEHDDLASLAATAVQLGRELDHPTNSATSKAQCAKALAEVMGELRAHEPEEVQSDPLDEIGKKRSERRAKRSA